MDYLTPVLPSNDVSFKVLPQMAANENSKLAVDGFAAHFLGYVESLIATETAADLVNSEITNALAQAAELHVDYVLDIVEGLGKMGLVEGSPFASLD